MLRPVPVFLQHPLSTLYRGRCFFFGRLAHRHLTRSLLLSIVGPAVSPAIALANATPLILASPDAASQAVLVASDLSAAPLTVTAFQIRPTEASVAIAAQPIVEEPKDKRSLARRVTPADQPPETRPAASTTSRRLPGPNLRPEAQPTVSDRDMYALGAGDEVRVDIFNAPELNTETNQYTILADGTVNLPWIGRVFLQGLNLEEASQAIAFEYATFLRDPVVTVSLMTARPTRVAVVGEVNRPGSYTSGSFATSGAYASGTARGVGGVAQVQVGELRTVIEALQTAGGITPLADIRNIQVQRLQVNGDRTVRTIDLWALLQDGDLTQDLTLRDGDTVLVPTVDSLNAAELQELAAASFAPDLISVNVVGEVQAPGTVLVSPNTSLNQAIFTAGGFDNARARRGEVRLIRLNLDGSVSDREIEVDLSAGVNDETNPPLRNNDIVVVSRSGLSSTADFLDIIGGIAEAVINPVRGVVDIFDTLDNIRSRDDDDDDDDF